MIKAEADIILAIHHLCNRFPFHTNIKHIYGHQDTKKPKRHIPQDEPSQPTAETDKPPKNPCPNPPSRTEPIPKPMQNPQQPPLYKRTLPTNVQINNACDGIAQHHPSNRLYLPLRTKALTQCSKLESRGSQHTTKKQYTMCTKPQH